MRMEFSNEDGEVTCVASTLLRDTYQPVVATGDGP